MSKINENQRFSRFLNSQLHEKSFEENNNGGYRECQKL